MRSKALRLTMAVSAFALIAAACGGDDSDSAADTTVPAQAAIGDGGSKPKNMRRKPNNEPKHRA